MKIIACSTNPIPGDVKNNLAQVVSVYQRVLIDQTDIVVFPEFALLGYPIDDLIRYRDVQDAQERAIQELLDLVGNVGVVIGVAERNLGEGKPFFNSAIVIRNHQIIHKVRKANLPTYGEFDESRWLEPGAEPTNLIEWDGELIGVAVCEDLWAKANRNEKGRALYHRDIVAELAALKPTVVISVNASPYWLGKRDLRLDVVQQAGEAMGNPLIVWCNRFGGQDELVFDGSNFALGRNGWVVAAAKPFQGDELLIVDTNTTEAVYYFSDNESIKDLYDAHVLAVRDYVHKNGFKGVVMGLSGGVDSAVTAVIGADAIGPENVNAVMMPFRYTSDMSKEDAQLEAEALGIRYRMISVERVYDAFMAELDESFAGTQPDVTEQNLQARIRGTYLMSLSNKFGLLVLTTGNKSENAVGYATLYGDMAGGFDVLKDTPKLLVYAMGWYRNSLGPKPVIPERVLTREPSAELAPDQKDQDNLPPYEVLDPIVDRYVVDYLSADEIVEQCFEKADVRRVIAMVDRAEYKRRQGPPGPKLTQRGLSPDAGRRVPLLIRHG